MRQACIKNAKILLVDFISSFFLPYEQQFCDIDIHILRIAIRCRKKIITKSRLKPFHKTRDQEVSRVQNKKLSLPRKELGNFILIHGNCTACDIGSSSFEMYKYRLAKLASQNILGYLLAITTSSTLSTTNGKFSGKLF